MIWRKGWVHPILNIVLGQILIAIGRQGKFWFSNSSDDVCFLFYINPSSMSLHVSCTVCTLFFGWQCHLVNLHGSGADFLSSWMTDLKNLQFFKIYFSIFFYLPGLVRMCLFLFSKSTHILDPDPSFVMDSDPANLYWSDSALVQLPNQPDNLQ